MTGKFLVTFSEAINTSTFTCDDIDFVGTAPGQTCISIDEVAPYNDTTFEVTTTASNDGSIITKINANKVTDIAGNPNWTSNTINNAITIDRSSLRLSPGDIVIVTANAHPDFFEFLVNKQLDPGTVIYFSDNAWQEDDSRRTWEWTIVFTSTTIIPAGTVISVQTPEITPTLIQNTLGTVSRINDFNLAVNGDNILIYQWNSHDDPNPSFVYWIGFWTTSPRINTSDPGTNKSYLPSSLTLWENTLNYNKTHRNIQYTCAIRWIYNESFNTYITDITNWTWNALSWSTFGPIVCDFDVTRPQATITLADGQSADTTWTIGKFLFTFSEAINTSTFTCDDISLDGTASNKQCTNIEEVSPNDWTSFEVSVSTTSTWTIIVDLDENKVEDLAKNPNSASITTENTIQFLEDSPALIYNVYLTYTAWANWALSGNANQTLSVWEDWTAIEAIADSWYHFIQRSDGRTDNPRTDLNVTGDVSVSATFIANSATTYNLTYSAGANGIVSGNLTQTVDQHNNWTPVRAIADDWYHFTQRSDGNTDNPRIDLNVTTNISVSAMFEIDESTDYVSNNSRSTYLSKDRCPGGDLSPSYYDWYCWEDPKLDETTHWSATKEKYVYYPPIKRYQLAMFVWKIANSLLTLNANDNDIECDFEDIKYLDNDTKAYIIHSCKHWIMWINADGLTSKKQFEPENIVSYNELATVLSRLLYGVKYNYETVWYEKHVEQIEKIWLLSKNDLITIESVAKIFSIIYKNPSMIER